MEMILADRGKYIAACLTICRAYIAAGRPNKLPQLASYGEWSDTVRSALVWLGEADPVKSQDMSHAEDPERAALLTMLNEWKDKIGVGQGNGKQLRDIVNLCDANKATPSGKEYINKGLREAVLGGNAGPASPQARRGGARLLASLAEGAAGRRVAVLQQAGNRPHPWHLVG